MSFFDALERTLGGDPQNIHSIISFAATHPRTVGATLVGIPTAAVVSNKIKERRMRKMQEAYMVNQAAQMGQMTGLLSNISANTSAPQKKFVYDPVIYS